jgi:hypothetical protein
MKLILVILMSIAISNCGFKPILAKNAAGYKVLTEVKIVRVEGPERFSLQRYVDEIFESDLRNNARYEVKLKFNFNTDAIGVMNDTQITRYRVTSILNYNMISSESNKIVNEGEISLNGSYDASNSDFANYVAERKVTEELTKELTKELVGRLSLIIADIEGVDGKTSP